jgi:HNH endonuclease
MNVINEEETTTPRRRPGRPITVTIREEDRGFSSPCWIWTGTKTIDGYGMLNRGGYHGYSHRYYFLEEYGEIPEGALLDHLCLQRECCRPSHLEPVTHAINVRRSRVAKLTPTRVQMIRAAWADRKNNPVTQRELADRFGISQPQISNIVTWNQWN